MPDPADPTGRTFFFDGWYDGVAIRGTARVEDDTITLIPVPDGKALEIPVAGFGQLASTLMIAAHAR